MRKSFRPTAVVDVKFTDDSGLSEGAVDEGGPRRELFQLLMDYLCHSSPVFIGHSHNKHISMMTDGEWACDCEVMYGVQRHAYNS